MAQYKRSHLPKYGWESFQKKASYVYRVVFAWKIYVFQEIFNVSTKSQMVKYELLLRAKKGLVSGGIEVA